MRHGMYVAHVMAAAFGLTVHLALRLVNCKIPDLVSRII
jgi:hypothetical protein